MDTKKVELKECEYQEIYTIFKKLTTVKNIPTFEKFKENLDTFFELTYDAYVGNMGSNTEAMIKGIEYMGSEKVALKYFRAVDNWHAYT